MPVLRESYMNHATVEEMLNMMDSVPEATDFEYIVKGGKIYYECNYIRRESDRARLHNYMQ